MPPKFLRPLLIVEFLIALQVVFTVWSEVGGQYHLDLMFWPWKLGVGLVSAWLITWITANLVRSDGKATARVWMLAALLIATLAVAGCVTYYYHLNEPQDEEDQGDEQPSITLMTTGRQRYPC
jgi:hypothetical protein